MSPAAATEVVTSEVRVRYQETDRMGVVYHANFLVWFEVGRIEFLRALGNSYREMEEEGVYFPVLEVSCKYRQPARFDDRLQVRTRAERIRWARLRFHYEVLRVADGTLLAEGSTTHAATDANGSPSRLPDAVLDRIEPVAEAGEGAR
ncbi:MAG: thioesterase family protein [Dehalococcoidia bacterium]